MQSLYEEFRNRADIYIVYIAEAHSADEWQTESNEEEGIRIRQAQTFEDRLAAAQMCADGLKLTIPTLVDGMDNAAFETFAAWPERIYILRSDGIVHFRGGPGPYEFNPKEARDSLLKLLEV